jgi:mono/diheme cytochrome c family protein
LEVRGAGGARPADGRRAADVGIAHLDAPRKAKVVPAVLPSAAQGRGPYDARCAGCHGLSGEGTERGKALGPAGLLRDLSPADVFGMLSGTEGASGGAGMASHGGALPGTGVRVPPHAGYTRGWSARERWDVVAYAWFLGTSADRFDLGQRLFLRNCAACHGERGGGDGPGGKFQPKSPANFADARRMLAGTSALYTAKIRRGGMGTGMPYWGGIFTEEELAALVSYVWTFSLGPPAPTSSLSRPSPLGDGPHPLTAVERSEVLTN